MTKDLSHRGPDGEGIWTDAGIGLGHRRLAIVDLSDRGAQPMQSEDGRLVITYNGEVYNYKELRVELKALGAVFRSDSDTEVILHAYRQWGSDAVKRFRGMFAFGIWDKEERRLFVARDRIGKKPLFIRRLPNGDIAIASELKALRPLASVESDPEALRLFFGLQYVPSPKTGFRDIESLPPGCRGFVSASDICLESYHAWDEFIEEADRHIEEHIVSRLEESIALRLRADVTVGAFLSGGIDSAAIVALAQKQMSRPLRTFTMGFPDIGMDERKAAQSIAKRFGTDHFEFVAQPEDMVALTEHIIFQYGGPYADSSALPVMMLSRAIAKEIKVVLVGDGGDELFGGYRRYGAYRLACSLARIPGSPAIPPALRFVSGVLRDPRYARMATTVDHARHSADAAYAELFCGSYFNSEFAGQYLHPDFLSAQRNADPAQFIAGRMASVHSTPIGRAMRFDLESYLPDDLNVKMDRATMAFGLEARAPFLDLHVVGTALGIPSEAHFRGGKSKAVLKRAFKNILPPETLAMPKRGFQVPLDAWFRSGLLAEYWKDHCLDPQSPIRDYVRQDRIKELFERHQSGADHGNRLWMLLSLAGWLEGLRSR